MSGRLETFLLVGVGAVMGANLRYLVIDAVTAQAGRAFPFGTILVNIIGSFGLAVFSGWLLVHAVDARLGLVIATGFFGGFTTFSTFANETVQLLQQGQTLQAAVNVIVSNGLCLLAVGLGLHVRRGI